MKNIIVLLVIVAALFSACEEKPVIIPEFIPIETGKVLLAEELTGVRCPNCPAGSARLETISDKFPGNVIIVGIHGIDLAKPLDESKYDFRNEDAAALEVYLKPFLGKPAAYFNRVKFENLGGEFGSIFQGQWEGVVEEELNKPQVTHIAIDKSYDTNTRVLEITITVSPIIDIPGEIKLSLMLTESEIEDAQDDQFEIVEDYTHEHVLRDVITTFNGDFFADGLTKGENVKKSYTYTVPESDDGLWRAEHIDIVAFVANTEGESEEVLQATTEPLLD
ncbi:MAG: Omp28-related outer membrane protein [Saprospiraceae bacterium]